MGAVLARQVHHAKKDSMDALADMMTDPMAGSPMSGSIGTPSWSGQQNVSHSHYCWPSLVTAVACVQNVRDRSGTNDLLDLVGDNEPASF